MTDAMRVVLAGAPNAGKSRLFDAIAAAARVPITTVGTTRSIETVTARRRYTIVDAPADAVDARLSGAHVMILVVAVTDGPMPETRRHVELARHAGVGRFIAYLDDARVDDVEITELVEMEVRELAAKFHLDGDALPVVRGRGDPRRHEMGGVGQLASLLDASG